MDPTILLIFALIGLWTCAGILVAAVFSLIRRRARRKRTVELFAFLCDAIDRDEAVGRHPAGKRWAVASRTTCGHLIFGVDPGDLIANEIQHVQQCHINRRNAA